MKVDLRFKPSFCTLFVTLLAGESILAESDAMASMSARTRIRPRWNGGFFRAILRKIFGRESLFINEISCPAEIESVQVVLTQPTPGDLLQFELDGNSLYLQPGAFVACTPGVKLGMGWAGLASWFGGEGLFRLQVSGRGTVWLGSYGAIFDREVRGEYIVDTGHLVAYEPTISLSVGLSAGIFSSFFGGEGFVSRVRGHGRIFLQTRSIEELATWTNHYLR